MIICSSSIDLNMCWHCRNTLYTELQEQAVQHKRTLLPCVILTCGYFFSELSPE